MIEAQSTALETKYRHRWDIPALILRWVQIRLPVWFNTQRDMMTDHASPVFGDLLGKIQMMEFWEPELHMQYYPSDFPLLPPVLQPHIPAPVAPPTGPTDALVVREGLSKVKNPNYNPIYQRYQTSSTIRRAQANAD